MPTAQPGESGFANCANSLSMESVRESATDAGVKVSASMVRISSFMLPECRCEWTERPPTPLAWHLILLRRRGSLRNEVVDQHPGYSHRLATQASGCEGRLPGRVHGSSLQQRMAGHGVRRNDRAVLVNHDLNGHGSRGMSCPGNRGILRHWHRGGFAIQDTAVDYATFSRLTRESESFPPAIFPVCLNDRSVKGADQHVSR